jgi:putative alpha-1,2-mannosidase
VIEYDNSSVPIIIQNANQQMQYTVTRLVLWLALFLLAGCFNLLGAQNPVDYFDPRISTEVESKRWILFLGATTPFGMIALSPNNLGCTGWYKGVFDPHLGNILGFSHIHAWTMAGLLTMPTMKELKVKSGPMNDLGSVNGSHFSNDVVSPRYYAVTLDDYKFRAEFTSTTRSVFHRYTFSATETSPICWLPSCSTGQGCRGKHSIGQRRLWMFFMEPPPGKVIRATRMKDG